MNWSELDVFNGGYSLSGAYSPEALLRVAELVMTA